jgi:predicted nuclease of predicted toxin-antitoxin system
MKFLLDHDVYTATARFLTGLGHEIVQVGRIGLARAEDEDLPRLPKPRIVCL